MLSIITHTPIWVWIILAYLIYQGTSELKNKVISHRYFIIMLSIILAVSVWGIIRTPTPFSVLGFLLGSILGAMGCFSLKHRPLIITKDGQYIKKGSCVYLCLYLFVFVGQYITTAIAHISPSLTQTALYELSLLLPRGVLLGVFWAIWWCRDGS